MASWGRAGELCGAGAGDLTLGVSSQVGGGSCLVPHLELLLPPWEKAQSRASSGLLAVQRGSMAVCPASRGEPYWSRSSWVV